MKTINYNMIKQFHKNRTQGYLQPFLR